MFSLLFVSDLFKCLLVTLYCILPQERHFVPAFCFEVRQTIQQGCGEYGGQVLNIHLRPSFGQTPVLTDMFALLME